LKICFVNSLIFRTFAADFQKIVDEE